MNVISGLWVPLGTDYALMADARKSNRGQLPQRRFHQTEICVVIKQFV